MLSNILKNMESENQILQPEASRTKSKWRLVVLVGVLLIGLAVGYFIGQYEPSPVVARLINKDAVKYKDIDFELFWQVWDKLNEKYVDKGELSNEKMFYGAIAGMVNSAGDPYTTFFEPVESKKFQEEISGSFGGVGLELSKKNNVLTVVSPLKGTPADKAGIKAGDKVVKINGKSTQEMSVDEAVNLIRGKKGTKFILSISNGELRDYELTRDTIKIPTVDLKYFEEGSNKIAYMQIYSFNQNVESEFNKAAQDIIKSGATRLILDLRNNPGGLLDSAINMAGWFLNRGQIVVMEQFGDGTRNEFKSNGNGLLKLPTGILMNGGSASGSEILAGALHDNRRIKLVGEKWFGKGSVQELENFSDGSSLKVTIAKWLTPNGISISEKGIEADIKVMLPEDPKELEALVIGEKGKDPQLDKALELLR